MIASLQLARCAAKREQAAGRFLFPAAGTTVPETQPVRNNDDANTANTSVVWPAAVHNHKPTSDPSTIVATDTSSATGRRRNFGGEARGGSAAGAAVGLVVDGRVVTDMG